MKSNFYNRLEFGRKSFRCWASFGADKSSFNFCWLCTAFEYDIGKFAGDAVQLTPVKRALNWIKDFNEWHAMAYFPGVGATVLK
jgi:hypothetical protein